MPTADEVLRVFSDNGIDTKGLLYDIKKNIDDGNLTKEQADNLLMSQYNKLVSSSKQKQTEQIQTVSAEKPNAFKGTLQATYQDLTFGAAPYIEGARSTGIGKIVEKSIPGIGMLVSRPTEEELNPKNWKEQYEKGKQQFKQEREDFSSEHPVLDTAGRLVGTFGSLALTAPIGGAAGAVAKARGLGTLAQRMASSAASFATYGGAKGFLNEGEGVSPSGAVKGALEEGTLGLAFPSLTGGARLVEKSIETGLVNLPLVKSAAEMSGLIGKSAVGSAQLASKTAGAALEGAAVATAAANIEKMFGEDRSAIPSVEEVIAGGVGVGAIRTVGAGVQKGAEFIGKLKQPTTRQLASISSQEIAPELTSLLNERENLRNAGKDLTDINKQISSLTNKLNVFMDKAEEDVTRTANKYGWELSGEPQIKSEGRTRYLDFMKDGKKVTVRIAAHKGIGGQRAPYVDYNLKNTPEENLPMIADAFADAERLRKGERLLTKKGKLTQVKKVITPTDEEIKKVQETALKKDGKKLSYELASILAEDNKQKIATMEAAQRGRAMLPLGERMRRTASALLRRSGEVLDTYSPVSYTHNLKKQITGKETPISERGDFISKQRDRGGKEQIRQMALADDLQKQIEKDSNFAQELQTYLTAKKNEDMIPNLIEELKSSNKNGQLDERIQNLEEILNKSKKSSEVIERELPNVVAHARKQWEYAQEKLNDLYESGRISKNQFLKWKNNKHYIHGQIEDVEKLGVSFPDIFEQEELRELNQHSGLADAFKKFQGYAGEYKPFALTNLEQGKRIYHLAETQKAAKAWLKDALVTGEAKPAEVIGNIPKGKVPPYNRDNQIVIWENGKANIFDVPKGVARAFNPTYKEEGFLLKNLRLTNNLFKLGTTGISTGFSAMNLIRDMQSVIGGSRSGMYFRPSYVKLAAKLYGPGSGDLTGSEKELRNLIDSKLGTEFSLADTQLQLDRSQLNRVNTMLESQGNANPTGTFIGDTMALLMKGASMAKAPAEKTFQSLAKTLSFLGNWSEKVGRTTVFLTELRRQAGSEEAFEAMIKNPKSITKEQANNAAKEMSDVTLEFTRKMHPVIEGMNRYVAPYFKPSLLGAERVWKVLTDPEIAPQAWRWLGVVGATQGLIRSEMDEEQKKKYESQFNPEISAKNLSIVGKNGVITMIPASQEFGGLYQWISAGTEYFLNKLKGKEQRKEAVNEIIAAASQFAQNAIPGGYLLEPSNLAPTPVGKMILEESINKDIYSKTDIESDAMRRLPVEERFSANTPRIYRIMSKHLKIGNLQSSPKMWEHRAKKLGSSFAKEMADVADVALEFAGIGEEEWNLPKRMEESSIVSRFFNKDYTAYARNVQEYDKEMKELEQAYTSHKKNPSASDEEKKTKAAIYKSIKDKDSKRIELISANQKILAALRRKGYSEWKRYLDGDITKSQFEKSKEIESAKAASKYYANQKKISDATDKLLKALREQKKKK